MTDKSCILSDVSVLLRHYRLFRGFTQLQASACLSVPLSTYKSWEYCYRAPGFTFFHKLSHSSDFCAFLESDEDAKATFDLLVRTFAHADFFKM